MSVPVDQLNLRADAAAQAGRLNDLVTFGDLDAAALDALADEIRAVVDRHAGPARPGWWTDGVDAAHSFRRRSPFSGTENPRAPGLVVKVEGRGPAAVATGEVTVGKAFGGPPGAVHGGVVAGLFDEVVGALGPKVIDGLVVTATLSVRFRRPTPLLTPLTFEARAVRHSSRRMRLEASCSAHGQTTATAQALMVGIA